MSNGTERKIGTHAWVRFKVASGKATKYDGVEYQAGETFVMRKYEADAHSLAGIGTIEGVVENYDPKRVEPVELNVTEPPQEV